ncbi:MAG: 2,3-bisphosphoglycerate-independent phosphoglycerate mutase [Candidatus Marinimicrobia bacterium]|nr:2,3-bisphosphoglycerate-independent phosphoglycerate mutase [Candidatus Neomarinimicrobiota bacterium]
MEDTYGNLISTLAQENDKRVVLLVMDGIGDVDNDGKGTALEIAKTPNLDKLAQKSAMGESVPVATGVTPGSGPGHLGLFGYDPIIYKIGRGVLSALGIEFPLKRGEIAARLNFCSLDSDGNVTDRRAGRIGDEENKRVLAKLKENVSPPSGVEVVFETVAEHRALMVLRGDGLDDNVPDTDPQEIGVQPLDPTRGKYADSKTAKIVKEILAQVKDILADEDNANMILTRGFAKLPDWPMFPERYQMKPAAVAGYPMYRGVARLVEIPVFSRPTTAEDVCKSTVEAMKDHTFVFAHFKYTDKTGEDGDIDAKVSRIEEMDAALPTLLDGKPDVLLITGDHSTPAPMKAHSWHPVPVLLHGPYLRGKDGDRFIERNCMTGQLGRIQSKELLPMAMAHAGKLAKYGA